MGILGLSKLILDHVPLAVKERDQKHFFGRKIAIDGMTSLYQFLVAVRADGAQLTSVDGEPTSHLAGLFYRTIRWVESGIKPIYVFDGAPPELKAGELEKRRERRDQAQKALDQATEAGNAEDIQKFSRRLTKVTEKHLNEAKELLKLMGVPCVEAPCEAEAQCAAMVKAGEAFAVATEDMDALTFGSNILLRKLTASATADSVQEYHLKEILTGLSLSQQEFIDLCILLGCDYCDSIRGIGPKKAIELIKKHRSIDDILKNIDTNKFQPPANWQYKDARRLFLEPDVTDPAKIELKWTDPDIDGLVTFLCGSRQFSEDRIRNGAKKLLKARTTSTQQRLDSFFTVLPTTNTGSGVKRKPDPKNTPNKRGKGGKGGRGRAK